MVKIFKDILAILDYRTKRKGLVLIGFMIFGGLLEILGIGVVIPVFSSIINIDKASNSFVLQYLNMFHDMSNSEIVAITLLILVLVFLIKNLFLGITLRVQMSYVFKTQVSISSKLFKRYLYNDFENHNAANRNELLNLIIYEVGNFSSVLTSMLNILSEAISVLFIGAILIIIQPIGTLSIICIFVLLITLFQKFTKKKVKVYSNLRLETDAKRVQIVKESLEGLKEIKILGVENYFLSIYRRLSTVSADANAKQNTLQQLPRFWTEFIAIFCLSVLIVILNIQHKTPDQIFLLVSMYALAAFRFIPSANRILAAFQILNYISPVLVILKKEMALERLQKQSDLPQSQSGTVSFDEKIEVKDLTFYYDANTPLFNKLNLDIHSGDSVGIIGPSGIGKSTLISVLLGLIKPKGGQILIDDIKLSDESIGDYHKLIGYVPQKPVIINDTIKSNIALGIPVNEISDDKIDRVLKMAMLSDFVNGLPAKVDTIVGDSGAFLSGGQCQRIAIARALYHDPQILIFDESTSSLDLKTEQEILNTISTFKKNKTIIIISHRPQSLDFCDKIFNMQSEREKVIQK
jgi:ABC-type multidrug transport system fused ATPase/permease subunit